MKVHVDGEFGVEEHEVPRLTPAQERALRSLLRGEKTWRHPSWQPDVHWELSILGLAVTGEKRERGRAFSRLTPLGRAVAGLLARKDGAS